MTWRQQHWGKRSLAFAVLAACSLSGLSCAQKARRMFSSCTFGEDCETGQCYGGTCSRSCTSNESCAGGICIEQKCVALGAKCDDHNACTVSDIVTKTGCAGAQITCDNSTPCQDIFCDAKVGCAATAKNIGATCEGSGLKACAAGGLATGGCKCSVWQSNPIGPYDKVSVTAGVTTTVPVGTVQVRAVAASGNNALLVGSARSTDTGPTRAWLSAVNATRQVLFSIALPPADVTATSDSLAAIAASPSRFLLAGNSGNLALVATLANPNAVSLGQEAAVVHAVTVKQGAAVSIGAALEAGGSFAVVGSVGDAGMMLRGKHFNDGDFADPVQNVLKSATAAAADTATLGGVATHPKGWLAAGTAVEDGKSKAWLVFTESGFGGSVASEILEPFGASDVALHGVVRRDMQWLIFGKATIVSKAGVMTQTGYVAVLDTDRQIVWQQFLGPAGKPPADAARYVAATPFGATQWLLLMAFGSKGAPWAVRTDGVTAQPQAVGGATRLDAVASIGNAFVLVGAQELKAFVQRLGPSGELTCEP